ncbi:MAG TPA: cell division protein ZipA C-terminal FtsZ-binding domain-containing protein [Burkholderiales bacterium]|nr:cell division protein ZipA C-terminal FtsZ-binding domain-containing protein [Burkholderiales bacterium]
MSDLQLGLLGIGVIVVVGVIAYNKWQEVKLRRRAETAFASSHHDVLFGGRAENREGPQADVARTPTGTPGAGERVEHTLGDAVAEAGSSQPEDVQAVSGPRLDAAVDFIIGLNCARPVAGSELLHHARRLVDEALVKPVHWEAQDETREAWRPIAAQGRHRRLRAGMQLADRSGAVSEEDLVSFCGAVQEVALAVGATAELPDIDAALAQARELDRFCADVDVLIGLSVIGSESHTFPGTKIRALAESAGLAMGRDGRFHRIGEDGIEQFSLMNIEPMPFHPETVRTLQTRGVTALFDVPRVPPSDTAFRRFIDFAHELEQALGGVLVDDNRKPIGQAALESIFQQLERIHATMDARGIPAGGPVALRLFS